MNTDIVVKGLGEFILSVFTTIRKMSFFPRTTRDWNLLPPDIVELDTPEAFKARSVSR